MGTQQPHVHAATSSTRAMDRLYSLMKHYSQLIFVVKKFLLQQLLYYQPKIITTDSRSLKHWGRHQDQERMDRSDDSFDQYSYHSAAYHH